MEKRWIQFICAVVSMIMIANLQYAWQLFTLPIAQAHKDWPLIGIQGAAGWFLFFETWVTPVEGWLIDRLGPRIFLSVGGILVGVGWTGMAYAQTLLQLIVLYSIAGVGAAFIYSGSVATALKWFPDKRGSVSGFITAGFGAGAALFIPTIGYLIHPSPLHMWKMFSWLQPSADYLAQTSNYNKAFLYTGIGQAILILICAQFLHNPGPDFQVSKAARAPLSARIRRNTIQFSSKEMLKTPHFYLLFITFVLINTGGSMITIQGALVAKSFKITTAALTAAITGGRLANGGGRIFWGWLSDRIGREMAMFIPYALQAISLLALLRYGRISGTVFTVCLMAVYFIWGSMFSLFPAIIGDYFGADNATSNYGFLYMAKGVAAFIASYVAIFFFQRFNNWDAVFYGSAVMAVLSAVIVLFIRARPLPGQRQAAAAS